MNTKQLTAFAEGMMRETSTQAGEWATVSRIALDEMAREALQAIKALQAAERERDELRAERDGAMESSLAVADAWVRRAKDAEAELARRDAAAVEVIYQFDCGEGWQDVDQTDYERYTYARGISTRKVYTAAPPAVLPPELSFNEALQLMHEYMLVGDANSFLMGANWMRAQAMALGAQQQNVVELPMPFDVAINLTRTSGDIEYQYHESGENFDRDEIFSVLDAANVKWEVKK